MVCELCGTEKQEQIFNGVASTFLNYCGIDKMQFWVYGCECPAYMLSEISYLRRKGKQVKDYIAVKGLMGRKYQWLLKYIAKDIDWSGMSRINKLENAMPRWWNAIKKDSNRTDKEEEAWAINNGIWKYIASLPQE